MIAHPLLNFLMLFAEGYCSFWLGHVLSRHSSWPIASMNSIRETSIVKSIGFQFFRHRKHLAKFVLGFTLVCDSLHSGKERRRGQAMFSVLNWN